MMSNSAVASFVLTLLALSTRALTDAVVVEFSAGEIMDISNLIQDVGLSNFEPATDIATQFTLFNQKSRRYFRLDGTDPKADHVAVLGNVGTGATPFWLKRNPGGGFVTIAPDVTTGLGNGAGAGGQVYTSNNPDWLKETTNQYAIRRVDPNTTSGPGLLVQNKGNGLCISLGAKNKDPLIVQTCSATDDKQRWQLCQPSTDGNLCWPQTDDSLQERRLKRHAPQPEV